MEKSELFMDVICVCVSLCSPLILSFVSVVFDFNAPLNDVAPVSPILLPVCFNENGKCGMLMDAIVCCFFLSLPHRLSFVSVVFDFNASPNDFAPVSPMLLPVCFNENGKCGMLMDVICVLFLFVFTTQIEFCEFCV